MSNILHYYFSQIMSYRRYLFLIIISLMLSGCVYTNLPWSNDINSYNTDIYRELTYANQSRLCFGDKEPKLLWNNNKKQLNITMTKILEKFFLGQPIQQVITKMQGGLGAICIKKTENLIICDYSYEFVSGMKKLNLTGWEKYYTEWNKNYFQASIISNNGLVSDIKSNVVNADCYEIDTQAYEKNKIIKKLKKTH